MPSLSTPAVQSPAPEVRFVFAAPSPYTARFDATRAGLGIALELQRLAREQQLPVRPKNTTRGSSNAGAHQGMGEVCGSCVQWSPIHLRLGVRDQVGMSARERATSGKTLSRARSAVIKGTPSCWAAATNSQS